MGSYLYVLSIGPVQDFISAARRTRDFWIGSHLLSEISKAAAKKITDKGGILIFPNSPDAPSVANVILAELNLPDGEDPSKLNKQAQEASREEWMQYANGAKCLAENLSREFVNQDIWSDQVDDVLEFYSAWIPMPQEDGEYKNARKRLMWLLAGRKAIRNFLPAKGRGKVPKSSLDGSRESVIQKRDELPKELALKMRLQPGEQLCSVALTKRLGGKRAEDMEDGENKVLEAFPSVVRVALDPWIRGIMRSDIKAKELLKKIISICEKNENIAQGTGRWHNGERRYPDFPFDGQVLHLSRIQSMTKPPKKEPVGKGWKSCLSERDREDLATIKGLVEQLQSKGDADGKEKYFGLGEPERYYAILVADGDRMGKVISTRNNKFEHLGFSAKLSEFADHAREIVKTHNGCMVYSGGDDVLAFLPLDCCLQAARELHECFADLLSEFKVKDAMDNKRSPTLSVGIAIGHSMEPLEDLLKFGRDAEKAAKIGASIKDERDGLAVHLYPRSGSPIKIREKWRPKSKGGLDEQLGLDERLLKWAEMHCSDELPDSAAYDMHELAEDYKNWDISSEEKKVQREKLAADYAMQLLEKMKQCNDELPESAESDAMELAEYCFKNWDISLEEKKEKLGKLIARDSLRLLKRKKASSKSKEALKIEKINRLLDGANSYEIVRRLSDEIILARRLANAMRQAKGITCVEAQAKEVAL